MTQPPIARYKQVAADLRAAITRGDYQPGQRIPASSELAERYDLTMPSVNKAIRLLATEGLVDIAHGSGTTVRERRPVISVSASYVTKHGDEARAQWSTEVNRHGMAGSQQIRQVDTVTPSAEVSGYLALDDDAHVVVRRRLLYADSNPVQLADSYYPAAIAAETELAESGRMPGGTVAALERLGYVLTRFDERVEARMPTHEEVGLMRLQPGTPVLRHLRVTYAAGDVPVEFSEAVMNAERHALAYQLPAEV